MEERQLGVYTTPQGRLLSPQMRAQAIANSTEAPPFSPQFLPRVIEPMLAEDASEPFDSPAHIFEVLWDGIRAVAFVEGGRTRLQDRWGRDVTHRFPELSGIATQVTGSGVALDGVIVCLNDEGQPDFRRLAPRLGIDRLDTAQDAAESAPVTFQAFDLLYREGQPLGGWPLRRRKDMLRKLVRVGGALAVPDWVSQDGIAFFEAARQHHLRGIVAKEIDSTYGHGERRRSWLKIPVYHKSQFVIGGYTYGGRWTPRRGTTRTPPAEIKLLVGVFRDDGRLSLSAEVPVGLGANEAAALLARLDEATVQECPFATESPVFGLVSWCRPDFVVSVRYAERRTDGRLRFPVIESLRPDVPARTCALQEHAGVR